MEACGRQVIRSAERAVVIVRRVRLSLLPLGSGSIRPVSGSLIAHGPDVIRDALSQSGQCFAMLSFRASPNASAYSGTLPSAKP